MTPTMERDSLVARLLEHADTQIEDNNRYIQKADELMREAAAALSRPEQVKPVATGPYVDRLIRIFRDRTDDDTSAVVLLDYAKACLESASCLALSPATAEDQAASKEGA